MKIEKDSTYVEAGQIEMLKKGTVVLVLEERQVGGHKRVRIGDDRWISRVTDEGVTLAQPAPGREDEALEACSYANMLHWNDPSYDWVTRKYTASHQWFEIPFIAYKIAIVFTSSESRLSHLQRHDTAVSPSLHYHPHVHVLNTACLMPMISYCRCCVMCAAMLDRPTNSWKLLALLTAFTLGFLALIIVLKPFRDHEGHSGWTVGDKGQVVAQVAALLQYAMAGLCVAFGDDMPVAVEGFVILVGLGAIVFPLIYMYRLDKGNDMLGCVFPSEVAAADGDDDKVVTENPVVAAGEDEEADQE